MKYPIGWRAVMLLVVPLVSSQIYPGQYELNGIAISESGSSETGNCSSVADSGRVCNTPRSSVIFDGIPTLTGLDGDMWARQLLTLNTSTSSASITFNFTTTSDSNSVTTYTGIETMEVVMFNCPSRKIGTTNIDVLGDGSDVATINDVPESCEYLVRDCIDTDLSTTSPIITINFNSMVQRLYLAEITFFSNVNRQCSPIGPLNTSVVITSGPMSDISSTIGTSVSTTAFDSTAIATAPTTQDNTAGSSGTVAAAISVVIVIVFIAIAVAIVIIIFFVIKRKLKNEHYSIPLKQTERKNCYTNNPVVEYEDVDEFDNRTASLSNKNSGNHTAIDTYEDMDHVEKKELVASTKTAAYEDIDEISSNHFKSGDNSNVAASANSNIYNKLSHPFGNSERRQTYTSDSSYSHLELTTQISISGDATSVGMRERSVTAPDIYTAIKKPPPKPDRRNTRDKITEETPQLTSEKTEKISKIGGSDNAPEIAADINKPPPKPVRRNTQNTKTDEPKEEACAAIPEKSEELVIYLDSKKATPKSNKKGTNQVDDIYTIPSSSGNVTTPSQSSLPCTSYSDNPLYTGVETGPYFDNVYSEPGPSSKPPENPSLENIYDSIYSELLNPSFFTQQPEECETADDLCPFSSIYTVPVISSPQEKPLEISAKNIREEKKLGSGQFGKVILAKTVGLSHAELKMGTSTDTTISVHVAVKMLKASASESSKKKFEKEYRFMFRLNHPNVTRMLGIGTEGTPFIMMEYMENGDLNQILKHRYSSIVEGSVTPGDGEITQKTLIHICAQIANGMNYLASNNFVHRDIATRNCLVGDDFTVKIADFGMSRSLYESHYYTIKGRAILPVRWMAYECFYGKFSAKTDVWAFGCTMWEVFELSKHEPYFTMTDQELVEDTLVGAARTLLSCPDGCPEAVYEIMKLCWSHEASERATFEQLYSKLTSLDM